MKNVIGYAAIAVVVAFVLGFPFMLFSHPKPVDPLAMAQQIAHNTDSVTSCHIAHGAAQYAEASGKRWYIGCVL